MTFRDFLEITAAIMTILVSLTILYGAFVGSRKKIFSRMHGIITKMEEKLEEKLEKNLEKK